ncbi:SRPBCC domain-containing protein [Kitasatospora sp. RB6PN24]|uniref:SRPBCC domain-containing protein n=1 Tax=Kitasatospora humi TaxID=2893891 RepID=UPI001E4ABA91|nr:SRPBCC domain-containing protein [Kitasatospora humi]MCC9308251.1 SRPBCC domain-containing protein [Kitasatospora humi]
MSISDWIAGTTREVKSRPLSGGPGYAAVARRTYAAGAEEVWAAVATPEGVAQWFLPVSGDLRQGGTFQLEGHAGGDIVECTPRRRLRLTWVFGDAPANEVVVTLSPAEDGRTTLELEHAAPVAGDGVSEFVLAVGAGWDPALVALGQHLADELLDKQWWFESAEARQFTRESVRAWADVLNRQRIADPAVIAKDADETLAFYLGE